MNISFPWKLLIFKNIKVKKIGITGQEGFVGSHLYNTLGLEPEKYERVPYDKFFFQNPEKLENFVAQCYVIVHLAAMNRHPGPVS